MDTSIVISGFGGQGTLFAGMVVAYAGLKEGHHVTWMPSYGPEMRGGTANATVIVSDEEVGSPVVYRPDAVIALNHPSVDKYLPRIRSGGTLVFNASIIEIDVHRSDISILPVPAGDIAAELGDIRTANMVALGALIAHLGILPIDSLVTALKEHLLANRLELLTINEKALQRGAELAQSRSQAVA
jgi:2-oxoglutarate ferredoxin oxidoreductase subunit gamma